ncbi:MAG: apolipoprotein N-acyltransferase [Paracoccaceae bacterium]|nr:apolipoprotein N-acyltransferase [Paracoccaceae bacterium]
MADRRQARLPLGPNRGSAGSAPRWRWLAMPASAGSGLVLALGQAPLSFPWGAVLALPALGFLFLEAGSAGRAFRIGLMAGCGYFALTMVWIVEPFLVRPDVHGWMAPFALVLTVAGMAVFWAVPFFAGHRLAGGGVVALPALAALWSLSEFLRSFLATGFPWGLIGYIWSDLAIIQLAAVTGPFGLSFLTLLIGFLPAIREWPPFIRLGVPAGAFVVALLFGWARESEPVEPGNEAGALRLRIVQPNAEQHLKWEKGKVREFFERQIRMSAVRPEGSPVPDLVIWPETAISSGYSRQPEIRAKIADSAGPGGRAIVGAVRRDGEALYNSILFLDRDGAVAAVYDKHHLVPFGEFFPLASVFGRLGLRGLAGGGTAGFSAGEGPKVIRLPGIPAVLPLICYEAVFPGDVRVSGDRPDWLLHVTNDAWFGELSGPYQHLAQARVRAIEQGLPLVRVANTGISAVIDARGRVLASLALGTADSLDAWLPEADSPPPYALTGEWPWLTAALVILGLAGMSRRGARTAGRSGNGDGGPAAPN